jgi:D-alanyl-D-alanine carboxypeptidase
MVGNKTTGLLLACVLSLVGAVLFPSVTNFTPAYAIDLTSNPIATADSLWVVVNKQRPLDPIQYIPSDLTTPRFGSLNSNPYGRKLRKNAAYAAIELAKAMNKDGKGVLVIQSAYRSYTEQTAVHNREVGRFGLKAGEALAARPGYSEHQTGLAMDVSARGQGCRIRVCFGQTKAGYWLAHNAYKYGFIVRYPNNSTATTGYQYEPWHLRFVGVELATEMKTKKVKVLELFFKLPAAPNY